ncbi:DUF106 domain-containing protein [Candidatus Woesearchaeota archaeon]|nr:DUF106 domain-containing protein [Candidatus Woesearchaeota archaeon]
MVFSSLLDPVFGPLLNINPFWAILLISLVLSTIITFVYKWMTNQHLMRTLKEDIKSFQKQMKELKHDPKKVMEVQKRAMETNMKYMMHSMKPTLVTFIPLIIIIGWLSSNLAYAPIGPNNEFTVSAVFEEGTEGTIDIIGTDEIELLSENEQSIQPYEKKGFFSTERGGKADWKLKGPTGEYLLEFEYGGERYKKELLITNEQAYKEPEKGIENSKLKMLKINNEKLKPLNLFGWEIGWLGTYIIFSIIFSMSLRKLLKLH